MTRSCFETALHVVFWALCPIWGPLACVHVTYMSFSRFPDRTSKRQHEREKKETEAWYARLPNCAFTGREDRGFITTNVSDQLQSSLLSRLPQEIKDEIYGYVTGGKNLEIEVVNSECTDDCGTKTGHLLGECNDHAHNKSKPPFRLRVRRERDLFAFIQTCKLA